jgi:hypothetical protein
MKTEDTLTITNDGPRIVATNYWETDHARAGKMYCSVNAGAIRILVPPALAADVEDWNGCRYVIVSRGPWPDMARPDAVELLFEDFSNSPYCLHLSRESFDLLPGDPGAKEWIISAWLPGPTHVFERPAKWRRVKRLPWLKAWK